MLRSTRRDYAGVETNGHRNGISNAGKRAVVDQCDRASCCKERSHVDGTRHRYWGRRPWREHDAWFPRGPKEIGNRKPPRSRRALQIGGNDVTLLGWWGRRSSIWWVLPGIGAVVGREEQAY